MSTSVGSIHYDLALDKSRFDSGAADVHSNLGGLASKAGAVAKQIAVAFSVMTVAATGFAIKGAADFEQTRIGLENMLGSADAARGILSDISKFAAQTPFEFPELAKSTRMLIAFGFGADDAFKAMQTLGDVSAAVGANLEDLSYLYGTLRAQGRAYTVDIKQFATRGIPIYKYLAQVLGVAEKEINSLVEAGKVGFPEVEKAFQKMTAEGGQFHDAMKAQSKSLTGQFSTLKDNIGFAARELVGINQQGDVREGSLFDRLRLSAAALNVELGKINWAEVSDSIMQFGSQVAAVANQVGAYLGPKFAALWVVVENDLMPALRRLWREVLEPLAPVVGTVLVAAFGALIDILSVVVRIVSAVIQVFVTLYTFFTQTLPNGLQAIGQKFNDVLNAMGSTTAERVGFIIGFFATLPLKVIGFWTKMLTDLAHTVMNINWGGVFSTIANGAVAAFNGVVAAGQRALNTLLNLNWGAIFVNAAKGIGNSVISLIEGAINGALAGIPGKPKVNIPRFADGTSFAPGGTALVGERGPELVNLPRGSQVIPNHELGGVTINLQMDGVMARSRADLRDIAKDMIGAINEELRAKNMPELAGGRL